MQQHPLCSVQTGRLSQSSIIFSEVIALSEPYKIHDLLLYIVKSSCHDRCLYHVAATSITFFLGQGVLKVKLHVSLQRQITVMNLTTSLEVTITVMTYHE